MAARELILENEFPKRVNDDYEQVIIGTLVLDKEAIHIISSILKPDDFSNPDHQQIYLAALELMGKSNPVDMVTLANRLDKNNELMNVGGPAYIAECANRVVSTANVEHHCRILLQMSIARKLGVLCLETHAKAHDNTIDSLELMADHEKGIQSIQSRLAIGGVPKNEDLAKSVLDSIERAKDNEGIIGEMIFGIPSLDKMVDGATGGELIVIASRPGMGKSSLANTIMKNYGVEQDKKVLFWGLETSAQGTSKRLMANLSGVSYSDMKTGKVDVPRSGLVGAYEQFSKSGLTILDQSGVNGAQIRSRLINIHRTNGLDLVMLDHGGLISLDNFNGNNDAERIGLLTSLLVRTAKELNIPIVLFWQLNRGVETRGGDKIPQMSDLRNSGRIEEDASKIIFLYRPEYYDILEDSEGNSLKGRAYAIVAKSKDSATGKVEMRFRPEFFRFEDWKEDDFFDNLPIPENNLITRSDVIDDSDIPF